MLSSKISPKVPFKDDLPEVVAVKVQISEYPDAPSDSEDSESEDESHTDTGLDDARAHAEGGSKSRVERDFRAKEAREAKRRHERLKKDRKKTKDALDREDEVLSIFEKHPHENVVRSFLFAISTS